MILVDTGFWVALFDRRDQFHEQAIRHLQGIKEPLVTTVPVLTETCYLLQTRAGPEYAWGFLKTQNKGMFSLAPFTDEHAAHAASLMQRYAALPLDLADASMVILAEELGHGRILTTDQRDFGTYRWKHRHPFENLMAQDIVELRKK